MPRVFECPGCQTKLTTGELIYPVPDVEEKVLPGEPMPEGECPECEELIREGNQVVSVSPDIWASEVNDGDEKE